MNNSIQLGFIYIKETFPNRRTYYVTFWRSTDSLTFLCIRVMSYLLRVLTFLSIGTLLTSMCDEVQKKKKKKKKN